jgi:carbon storage regulator
MLILSRKINESIVIDGQIIVKILRVERDTVKLGIQAPSTLPVHRQEVHEAIQRGHGRPGSLPVNGPAAGEAPPPPVNGNGHGSHAD